jgi:Raf kinase inhibitor-like YbhB/YbcL family protein
VPEKTASFAFWLEDKDAIPVCGFSWIHWVGANLDQREVKQNESVSNPPFLQGANSNVSPLAGAHSIEESSYYSSMSPPDKDHLYELHVFALDTMLDLESGFFLNELYRKMQGHVLETTTLSGCYRA